MARCVRLARWQATECWAAAAMSAAADSSWPCSRPAQTRKQLEENHRVTCSSSFTEEKRTFLFFLLHHELIDNVLKSRKREVTVFSSLHGRLEIKAQFIPLLGQMLESLPPTHGGALWMIHERQSSCNLVRTHTHKSELRNQDVKGVPCTENRTQALLIQTQATADGHYDRPMVTWPTDNRQRQACLFIYFCSFTGVCGKHFQLIQTAGRG